MNAPQTVVDTVFAAVGFAETITVRITAAAAARVERANLVERFSHFNHLNMPCFAGNPACFNLQS